MRLFLGRASAILFPLFGIAACNPNTDDLFASGGAQGGNGGASVTNGSKASTSSMPPDTTPSSSVDTTGSTNPDTVASSTSGTMDVASSANASSSASGNPNDPVVACGNAGSCSTADDGVCCFDSQLKTSQCSSADDCGFGNGVYPTAIACQRPADCPGEICCAHRYFGNENYQYESTSCESDCELPDRHICNPMAPTNVCPTYMNQMGQTMQMICKASQLLPAGYFVCGPP